MSLINISQKRTFNGEINKFSSEADNRFNAKNILFERDYWRTKQRDVQFNDFIIIDYKEIITINFIKLLPSTNTQSFPKNFRIEASIDGETWEIIHSEKNCTVTSTTPYLLNIPLTKIKFLKLFITEHNQIEYKYFSEIAHLNCGISGIKTNKDQKFTNLENLFDGNNKTYWTSPKKENPVKESIFIEFDNISVVTNLTLSTTAKGFPQSFSIDSSTDNKIWTPLIEEINFISESFKKYSWKIQPTHLKYLKINGNSVKFASGFFAIEIANIDIFAENTLFSQDNLNSYASIFQAGIVKLAKDGDEISGSVVQSNDRRLRDASTIFKGIVQLASDNDDSPNLAVQANDSRLQNATDIKPGIMRLAYDRENKEGAVVQANDSRLQSATEKNFGIVKLCPNGISTERSVVTGTDSRLQNATTNSTGICKLAENGESISNKVVQADDKRLKDATTTSKGIIKLAEDGEDKENTVIQANDKRLKEATTTTKGIVELAEDGENLANTVVQGNDKRLKDATTTSKGIVELAEDGENRENTAVQGNDKRLEDATTISKGIVELAEDGENLANTAVQGNDKRLKDATTISKGIVRLADDGENLVNTAVQGNDKRLKNATTISKGIVELAENGETRDKVVVQGNDNRLKDATTTSKGIVELAEDGEIKEGVAVQGNDKRLNDATTSTKGITRFAKDGEKNADTAVQGNDKRLKDATTTSKGIVELAEDGETKECVAVQGNDKRLKDATTTSKGIVELAEDGETKECVAVQGNDKRLKDATEESPGIVKFAKLKEIKSKHAVQSNDPRLSDAREPKEHEHNYASITHSHNSHTGTLSITDKKHEVFHEIVKPSDNSTIIFGENNSTEDGSIAISGVAGTKTSGKSINYGVVGHSSHVGVRGQSIGNENNSGAGVVGISRFGTGGYFSSEHSYSLVADGFGKLNNYDPSHNLIGNGNALQVNGNSDFNGKISIKGTSEDSDPSNIVEYFEVIESEYISAGDLLLISKEGKSKLTRSREEYSKSVIGIVSKNPTININNSGKTDKIYPVTLAGKVMCKVDARKNPINPGDLIVSSATPGCAMSGKIDSFDKIGTVIGKALDSLSDGIGLIPIFITHQ